MYLRTDVINETRSDIELMESRHGLDKAQATLQPGGKHQMTHSPHDTYREYLVLHIPTGRIKLTPDDLIDNKTVRIKYGTPETDPTAPEKLYWVGEQRNNRGNQNHPTVSSRIGALWQALFRSNRRHEERQEGTAVGNGEPSSATTNAVPSGGTA